MTKAEITKAIYLTGTGGDYRVQHNIPGQAIICHVPTVEVGNAIVRALRELASKKPRTVCNNCGVAIRGRIRVEDGPGRKIITSHYYPEQCIAAAKEAWREKSLQ